MSARKTVVMECWRDGLRSVDLNTLSDEDLRLEFATLLRTGVRTLGTTLSYTSVIASSSVFS